MFEIPPSSIAAYDQRHAAIVEALEMCVAAHRANVFTHGTTAAVLRLAGDAEEHLESDPDFVVDLLAVAIHQLSKDPA
ncbi:hypothetical protein [Mycobacterium phage WXIN]|nr:hypothetical protein [Mycobacterium phage WXIN]